jgi:hypothetical protein
MRALLEPTILTDMRDGMKVIDQEIFGSCVGVLPFDALNDAINHGNNTPFALAAGIGFAIAAAHEIDEGFIGQVGGTNFPRAKNGRLGLSGVLDRRVAPECQIPGGRHQPPAVVAERSR